MELMLEGLDEGVRAKAAPFLRELVAVAAARLQSLHLVGSAATPDWVAGRSDVNTLLVMDCMDLGVVEAIAPLGRRWHGKGIAPPLVMDAAYVAGALDVFPLEFLEMQAVHRTVFGGDLLAGLEIRRADLRHQCEREIRSRLVGLQQAYLRSLGEPKALAESLVRFLAGYQPLARGVLTLLGREVPPRRAEVFAALAAVAGPDASVFGEVLAVKEGRSRPDAAGVRALFERCHRATQQLGRVVDALAV